MTVSPYQTSVTYCDYKSYEIISKHMVIYTDIHTRSHRLPQEPVQSQESLAWINICTSLYKITIHTQYKEMDHNNYHFVVTRKHIL